MSDDYPYEGATFGDYRLVRGLGHGGFADVYLGTDITLGKSVAIKVMNTKVPRQQQVDDFKKEARVVARMEHRHIIEVYRYGVEGAVPYVVMKYAPNGSVRSKQPRGTVLSLETVVDYVRQVAEALQGSGSIEDAIPLQVVAMEKEAQAYIMHNCGIGE